MTLRGTRESVRAVAGRLPSLNLRPAVSQAQGFGGTTERGDVLVISPLESKEEVGGGGRADIDGGGDNRFEVSATLRCDSLLGFFFRRKKRRRFFFAAWGRIFLA